MSLTQGAATPRTLAAAVSHGWPVWSLVVGAALFTSYLLIPEGDDAYAPQPLAAAPRGLDAERLAITSVMPTDPAPDSAVRVMVSGYAPSQRLHVWLNKTELPVLAHRGAALVVRLRAALQTGHAKLRVVQGNERSKAYELHIKAINWRKPFRNLCGGLGLLVLGVHTLSRAARGVLSLRQSRQLARLADSRLSALGVGAIAGATTQSTTTVAGLLAGLIDSRVLGDLPAAVVFVGAQLGAAIAPLAAASVAEPHWGLPTLALGTWLLGFARDRRSQAVARLVIGVGLVVFGVQVLRPGFEPFVSNPLLLAVIDQYTPTGVLGMLATALLGALLVAIFQGPAPVLILALGISELTGHVHLRSVLALLAGSGFGAGLATLLTTVQTRSRGWVKLNLLAGLCSSLLSVALVDGLSRVAEHFVTSGAHPIWNGKHQLPANAWGLSIAFVVMQLMAAVASAALLPWLRRASLVSLRATKPVNGPALAEANALRATLLEALQAQHAALPEILTLALQGKREAGRSAEHRLLHARTLLEQSVSRMALLMPGASGELGRLSVACRQLQHALDALLSRAERLTEQRIAYDDADESAVALCEPDQAALRDVHGLISDGMLALATNLREATRPDSEETRAREILLNAAEARARQRFLTERMHRDGVVASFGVVEMIDAYETAGNQLYRLAETLDEVALPSALRADLAVVRSPIVDGGLA